MKMEERSLEELMQNVHDRCQHRNDLTERIEQQIYRLNALIQGLLADVDVTEMSLKDRMAIATRFMALEQRALILLHTCEEDDNSPSHNQNFMEALARRMREGMSE